MNYICPVCGYAHLTEPAYIGSDPNYAGVPSYDICPSCGFQFGHSDDVMHFTFEQWRAAWIMKNMKWQSIGIPRPINWDARAQLRNIGIVIE